MRLLSEEKDRDQSRRGDSALSNKDALTAVDALRPFINKKGAIVEPESTTKARTQASFLQKVDSIWVGVLSNLIIWLRRGEKRKEASAMPANR